MQCTSCGQEFEGVAGQPCPHCGSVSATASTPAAAPPQDGTPGEPPAPPPDGPAWERERSFMALLDTIKGALIEPSETFRTASRTASIGPALLFGLVLGVFGAYLSLAWDHFFRAAFAGGPGFEEFIPPEFAEMLEMAGPATFLIRLAITPVFLLVGFFLGAAIVHLLLLLLGGAVHGFEATFRTYAYAYGPTALFQAVPICGSFVGTIWFIVVLIIGIKEMHGISGGKAAAAVLLPFLLCCCAGAALVFTLITMIANSAGGF